MRHVSKSQEGNPFVIPFLLILVFAVVEFYGGIWTQSLALLSDAWHMLSDVFALGLAIIASHSVRQAKLENRQTKAELVVSALSAMIMLAVIAWIVIEAVERLNTPRPVASITVMVIAFIGLVVNLIVVKQLHQHEGEKGLNHQAAILHVIGDVLGSVAALVAGLVIYLTGWLPVDAVLSLFIALLLLIGTGNLIKAIWVSVQHPGTGLNQHDGH